MTTVRADANKTSEPTRNASTPTVSDTVSESAKRQIGMQASEGKAHAGRGPAFSDAAFSDAAFYDSPRTKR